MNSAGNDSKSVVGGATSNMVAEATRTTMTTMTIMDRKAAVNVPTTTTTIGAVPSSLFNPKAKDVATARLRGAVTLGPWVASIVAISQRMRTSLGWSPPASSMRGVDPDARGRGVDMVGPRVESAGMRMAGMMRRLGERLGVDDRLFPFFSHSLLLS